MTNMLHARIIRQERDNLTALAGEQPYLCAVAGRFRQPLQGGEDQPFPVVGDYVDIVPQNDRQAVITAIHARRNTLRRKKAGNPTGAQTLAANIDQAFIVHGLDGGRNFNVRRMERFLSLVRACEGLTPSLVLNKADLSSQLEERLQEVAGLFPQTRALATSARTGSGLDELCAAMPPGSTSIFLGPSGVGKSALLNALAGRAVQREEEQREQDKRGRHTTTNRRMFLLPHGAWLIDTPGIRELALWEETAGGEAFQELEHLGAQCRFRDCRHNQEPGCAVRAAVEAGQLDHKHYDHYLALQQERVNTQRNQEEALRIRERRSWKKEKYAR